REGLMSLEIYVLSDKRLLSIKEWQRAIDLEGFKLVLATGRPIDQLSGNLPALLNGQPTGFECDHRDADTLRIESPNVDFKRKWKTALAFRWGGDFNAGLAAYIAATAYARATAGVVCDCQEGKVFTAAQCRGVAEKIERDLPAVKAAVEAALNK